MYKILIVGHGGFPKGMKEALDIIVGKQESVSFKSLDKNTDHDALEKFIANYLQENKHAILFADLSGGAPHKIGARAVMSIKTGTHFIVAGAPLVVLIQLGLMLPTLGGKEEDVKKVIEEAIKESMQQIRVMGS